jgi:hypothetical protein
MRTLVQDPRGVMIRSGEPSNHLDLGVVPWLEHYVVEHDGRRVSHGPWPALPQHREQGRRTYARGEHPPRST